LFAAHTLPSPKLFPPSFSAGVVIPPNSAHCGTHSFSFLPPPVQPPQKFFPPLQEFHAWVPPLHFLHTLPSRPSACSPQATCRGVDLPPSYKKRASLHPNPNAREATLPQVLCQGLLAPHLAFTIALYASPSSTPSFFSHLSLSLPDGVPNCPPPSPPLVPPSPVFRSVPPLLPQLLWPFSFIMFFQSFRQFFPLAPKFRGIDPVWLFLGE